MIDEIQLFLSTLKKIVKNMYIKNRGEAVTKHLMKPLPMNNCYPSLLVLVELLSFGQIHEHIHIFHWTCNS